MSVRRHRLSGSVVHVPWPTEPALHRKDGALATADLLDSGDEIPDPVFTFSDELALGHRIHSPDDEVPPSDLTAPHRLVIRAGAAQRPGPSGRRARITLADVARHATRHLRT
ncbi:hypothetical protein ACIRJR_11825 [Streptomyces sp. NPDC102402]|uniref:hypothetical protein n=1 Tax=Streptomyces sp. NPDC102402 TaxID=3366169 RepID=UPI0038291C5C